MRGVNRVVLLGNLGSDPDVRKLKENLKVAKVSLATSETYRDKEGQKQTQTEWHTILLWNVLADLAELYLRKGHQIYVEGKLRTRNYEDSHGVKKYVTEVVADQILLLEKKASN
jgi:single-strand DNA-binding protein